MSKIIRMLIVLNVVCLQQIHCQTTEFSKLPETNNSKIANLLKPLIETNNFSGTILIAKKGEIQFLESYQYSNREEKIKNTPDSKYYLASISMIFTASAILKLRDMGKLSLSDKLSKYFPEYPNGNKISLAIMLAQRSGIPEIGSGPGQDYSEITSSAHQLDELINYFKTQELKFEPGNRYAHARSEYILLAKIIEIVSGDSFADFLSKEIFQPAHMQNSGHQDDSGRTIKNMSIGYEAEGLIDLSKETKLKWSAKTGHASLYSTVIDLNNFVNTYFQNTLLSKKSWQEMLTNHGENVGYSWFIFDQFGKKRFYMSGRSPGFSSYLAVFPEEQVTFIILANTSISVQSYIGRCIAAIYFNQNYDPLNLSNEKLSEENISLLIGEYQFGENFYRSNYKMTIIGEDGRISNEWGALIPVLTGDGPVKYFIQRAYWSLLNFSITDNKAAISLRFDSYDGKRIE